MSSWISTDLFFTDLSSLISLTVHKSDEHLDVTDEPTTLVVNDEPTTMIILVCLTVFVLLSVMAYGQYSSNIKARIRRYNRQQNNANDDATQHLINDQVYYNR